MRDYLVDDGQLGRVGSDLFSREDELPVLPPFPDDRERVLDLGLLLRDVDDLLDVGRELLDVQVDEGVHLELPDRADTGLLLKNELHFLMGLVGRLVPGRGL